MTMTGSLVRDKYNRDLHFKDALNVALENKTQISGWPSFVKKSLASISSALEFD